MNDRDRDRLDQLISSQGEIKAELVALVKQMERMNGSVAKHFAADATWMEAHDLKEARTAGVVEGRTSLRKTDMAIIGSLAGLMPMAGYAILVLLR